MEGWAPVVAGAAVAAVVWRLLVISRVLAHATRVPRVSEAPAPRGSPLVSVLVPARNEERTLPACLASLAAQRHPALEIILVDDASSDRTAEVARAAADRDARLRVIRTAGPPPGWTGKNFALASGVAVARGPWLCFTDADTVHDPDSIRRALGLAESQGLALLSMTSRQLTESFWERTVQPVVFGLLDQWFPLSRINDPASPVAAANGIFLLVSREAYEAVGGHRAFAGEILEDVALARNVKRSGRRIAFANGSDLVSARMYGSLGAARRGWTKNLYALRGRRVLCALGSAIELGWTALLPPLAAVGLLGAGRTTSAAWAAGAAVIGLGGEALFRVRRGYPPVWSLTHPLGAAVVLAFLLESMVRTWLGLGLLWKDRRYT